MKIDTSSLSLAARWRAILSMPFMLHRLSGALLTGAFAVLLGTTVPFDASAQTYPSKPVRIVVPYAAGGATDTIGRSIGQRLAESLGQPVIVENLAGANGNIGSNAVAKSAPDGYTLLLGTIGTHAINPSLYAKMPYDAVRDFAPITLAITNQLALVVNPARVGANTLAEFIALAQANPGKFNFGSVGSGSSFHLAGELFNRATGVKAQHVPYKSGVTAITDLVSGQFDFMFADIAGTLQHIRSGKLRALAVPGARRSALLPDVPTVAEAANIAGYAVSPWMGFFAPAGTPPVVVERLSADINRILATPEITQRLFNLGAEPIGSSPAEFARHIRSELDKWAVAVKSSGARID